MPKPTSSTRLALGASLTAIAAVVATVPAPALAAPCAQYRFPGSFAIMQSNNFGVTFASSTTRASGTAFATGGDASMFGAISGNIEGRTINLKINWRTGSKGTYQGTVADDGFAHGTTFDQMKPSSTARWDSVVPLICVE